MKKLLVMVSISVTLLLTYSCGGDGQSDGTSSGTAGDETTAKGAENSGNNPAYDPKRGQGKFTNVEVSDKLNPEMAAAGEKVYNVKCSGCHKLTDERLVGPGWKGVSSKHKAEWVMNFVTNTDEMIDKDPQVQAQLEICMVRMPNQNVSDEAARNVYEFMRKNDGIK